MNGMVIDYSNLIWRLILWFLFSLGLWKLGKKLRWPKRWMAFVPGLRYYALGKSMQYEKRGIICGILDVITIITGIVDAGPVETRADVIFGLVVIVSTVFTIVYSLMVYQRVNETFGLSKKWILLWMFVECIPALILGFGKKYQPVRYIDFSEDWEAGTEPTAIPETENLMKMGKVSRDGLSVRIKERKVRNLSTTRYLLKDISLDIPNGSLVLLLGGSGSGKTTFVNALTGYEKANAEIRLNGGDVYRDYAKMKYRIGFVPQQNLVRGSDTVRNTIDDAAEIRLPVVLSGKERNSRVQDVLDLLGLAAGADGLVGKKSGGMLRRISIAMELIADPELFVLDEPDSGLDGVIARELFTKLRMVADEGRIVIVITHTPDRVIDLFDKVIVLARDSGRVGRLAFYGSPDEAREFFGKDTMEQIVMSVNSKAEGGEGRADEFIRRYALMTAGTVSSPEDPEDPEEPEDPEDPEGAEGLEEPQDAAAYAADDSADTADTEEVDHAG